MTEIVKEKVYTSSEASTLLKIHQNTFLKLAKSGKIRTFRSGHHYRITGQALLDYMGSDKSHEDLVRDFQNLLTKLNSILKSEGKDLSLFLSEGVIMHADTKTLRAFIRDMRRYIILSTPTETSHT